MNIEDIIKKLEELKEEDCQIGIETEPIVDCFELLDGTGYETITHRCIITLQGNPIRRKYKKINGIKKYLGSDKK